MAETITNGYAGIDELKRRLNVHHQDEDTNLAQALESASREVDAHTRRHFWQTDAGTIRYYRPRDSFRLEVDDIVHGTITEVATDADADGTYSLVWAASDYEVDPYDGQLIAGVAEPVAYLMGLERAWPVGTKRRNPVRVTATFGWAAIPDAIRQATLELAAYRYKSKDAPLGVAGFGDLGGTVRARELQSVKRMLDPYRRSAG